MGLIFNGNGDVIKAVDGSLTVEGLDLGGGTNINAGIATFSGNVNVGGVLTYEDVKNVDSVGIITARDHINIVTDNKKLQIGAGQDLTAYHDGTDSWINSTTGDLKIRSQGDDLLCYATDDIYLMPQGNDNGVWIKGGGAVTLYHNNLKKFETTSNGISVTGSVIPTGNVNLGDSTNSNNNRFIAGASDDLMIYHNGSSSFISDEGTGSLKITTNGTGVDIQKGSSETIARFIADGAVELYNNNVKTFETTTDGVTVKGSEGGSAFIYVSADEGDDNADKWRHLATVGGQYFLSNYASGGWEHNIGCTGNGAVELYYDSTKTIETTSGGAQISNGTGDAQLNIRGGSADGRATLQFISDDNNANNDNFRLRNDANNDFYLQNYASGSWETHIKAVGDGAVELYYNGAKTVETTVNALHLIGNTAESNITCKTSDGTTRGILGVTNSNSVTMYSGSSTKAWEYASNALTLYHTGNAKLATTSSGINVTGVTVDDGATHDGDVTFTGANYNMLWRKAANALRLYSNVQLNFGDGDEGDIYRDTSQMIVNNASGNLKLRSNSIHIAGTVNEKHIVSTTGFGVTAYYNNSAKLETTNTGVSITGNVSAAQGHYTDHIYIADKIVHTGDTNTWLRFPSNDTIAFGTGGTTKLQIASDGQIFVGPFQGNYGTVGTAAVFQIYGENAGGNVSQNIVNHASANASSTCDINIWQNYRLANRIVFGRENANNWQSSAAGAASYTAFYTNSAGTVAEKLRIESNGDVAINTTDSDFGQTNGASQFAKGDPKLGVLGSISIANFSSTTTDFSQLAFYRRTNATPQGDGSHRITSTSNLGRIAWFGASNDTSFPDEVQRIECIPNGGDWWAGSGRRASMRFTSNGAPGNGEYMRLNSGGQVHIGSSGEMGNSHSGWFQVIHTGGGQLTNDCLTFLETNSNDWCMKTNYNQSSSSHYHIDFMEEGSRRGTIMGSDGSNVAFTPGSDYRMKENVVDLTGTEGINYCKNLKPRKYNWIDNRKNTGQINTVNGFIAHEVEEAGIGHLVYGNGKDAVNEDGSVDPQTLDYAGMTPILAAAIKGLISKVETLEAEVASLKG